MLTHDSYGWPGAGGSVATIHGMPSRLFRYCELGSAARWSW